mmetsp:Transcript_42225/g.78568  ORF Transcript_42225/g.78568 Transcript_42225/m.78568 type:complete len:177 (+) Transcript_42225:56-586(+)
MVATNQRRTVGQSQALGTGGSVMTLAQNSATRRALAASVTQAALEKARLEREPPMTHYEMRQKEARCGLNQLGLSSFPRENKGGWGWCVKGRNTPELSGLKKSMSVTEFAADSSGGPVISETSREEGEGEKPFYGEERPYGEAVWDGRMRGGELARNGWAGTFPLSHQRGCMPWAG